MQDISAEKWIPNSWQGFWVASGVLLVWLATLLFLVFGFDLTVALPILEIPSFWLAPFFMLVMSVLFTGLFITAHDAMHALVLPKWPAVNDWVGRVALFSYAGFSFSRLRSEHVHHHRAPASAEDPDYHNGTHTSLWAWYLKFLWQYRSLRPFLFFSVMQVLVVQILKQPMENFLLFWAAPALLSSFQLFYFGTYLPHREPAQGYNQERAVSNDYPVWLSFLTCFHFGYHFEHHRWPFVPWWRLARVRTHTQKA